MFEKAIRMGLRFSYRGPRTVEELWLLSVEELDTIYKGLSFELKELAEDSLLETKSKESDVLDLKIAIVKHIVETKLKEREERENAATRKERKQKLLAILEEKQSAALHDLPEEELQKLIDQLGE